MLVELHKITVLRDEVLALKDLSWQMERGQNWFIMGNNGSGKTTLLELIMAYVWPRKGSVTVLGELYGHTFIPDIRKRIGYVSPWIFERIHHALPVKDVVISGKDASVGFWGKLNADDLKKVISALELFDADHLTDRLFGELSSGEQSRVIMARAMINQPEILILDEPFSQLDMGTRLHLYARLEHISRQKKTNTILVTHHLEDIRPMFTHGLLLKNGKVFASGMKQDMLDMDRLAKLFDINKKRLSDMLSHGASSHKSPC